MSQKSLTTLAVGAILGVGLLAPSAQAAPSAERVSSQPVTTAFVCPEPVQPAKSGNFAVGSGNAFGCGNGTIEILLQRHRAWGWSPVAQGTFNAPGTKTLYWDCSGVGTYTYRTLVSWRSADGKPHNRTSAEKRFSC